MSIEETNRARLKEAWARWAESKGDPPSMWREYMSDDIQLFSLADGDSRIAFTQKRSGYAEIEEYLDGLVSNFSMNLWEINETVAEGDRVVGIGRTGWTAKATGKSFITPIVIVTRWRDGMMCEYGEYYDTAKVAGSAV